jgi:hypothetical protein
VQGFSLRYSWPAAFFTPMTTYLKEGLVSGWHYFRSFGLSLLLGQDDTPFTITVKQASQKKHHPGACRFQGGENLLMSLG